MSANLKTQSGQRDWKRSILIPIPKKGNTKECSNHWKTAFISYSSKVMLKILHARLQHYANQELPDIQAGFRKCRGTRGQLSTFTETQRKQGNSRKTSTCFIDYAKVFDCVDHNKLWKALKETDHITCLLRNLYVGQEATVKTLYGTIGLRKAYTGLSVAILFI